MTRFAVLATSAGNNAMTFEHVGASTLGAFIHALWHAGMYDVRAVDLNGQRKFRVRWFGRKGADVDSLTLI